MSEVESNNRTFITVALIVSLLIGGLGYMGYDYYKKRVDADVEVQKQVQLEKVKIDKEVELEKANIDAAVEEKVRLEQTRIEQEAATQRTRERMHWVPWYKDEENRGASTE